MGASFRGSVFAPHVLQLPEHARNGPSASGQQSAGWHLGPVGKPRELRKRVQVDGVGRQCTSMQPQPSIEPGGHQQHLTGQGKPLTEADLRSKASGQASNRQRKPSREHCCGATFRLQMTGQRHPVASTTVTIPAILYALLRWTASAKIRGSAAGPVRISTWSYRSPWSEPVLTLS